MNLWSNLLFLFQCFISYFISVEGGLNYVCWYFLTLCLSGLYVYQRIYIHYIWVLVCSIIILSNSIIDIFFQVAAKCTFINKLIFVDKDLWRYMIISRQRSCTRKNNLSVNLFADKLSFVGNGKYRQITFHRQRYWSRDYLSSEKVFADELTFDSKGISRRITFHRHIPLLRNYLSSIIQFADKK